MKPRWGAAALALLLAASAAAQQGEGGSGDPATQIRPDASPALSLGTRVSQSGNVHLIDGGTRAGANLFHSFARFDLGRGDVARWTHGEGGASSIRNIVSRVTGGTASTILGTLDSSALPNADFWFVNPAGILFGQGARVNVPAGAHFSTARELAFADGRIFSVATPGGSTFSMEAPSAFGFVGGEGDIRLDGTDRTFLVEGGRLSLVARDVVVGKSSVAGGRFELIGAGAGPSTVNIADPGSTVLAGNVTITDSLLRLNAASTGGGGLGIGGGRIEIANSELGTSRVAGPDPGVGGVIDIAGSWVTLSNTFVSASTFGSESAGTIRITGRDIRVTGGSEIVSDTGAGSTGEAGQITITGDDIRLDGASVLSSSTRSAQKGGDIVLRGGRILLDLGLVEASALPGSSGDAGAISIGGDSLEVRGSGSISSATLRGGDAGNITIRIAGPVRLDHGFIASDAGLTSTGDGGTIDIEAKDLSLGDESQITSGTFGTGTGGRIAIRADTLSLDRSAISSANDARAEGGTGSIAIAAGDIRVANGSRIGTESANRAPAGKIEIAADHVRVESPFSRISSSNFNESGGDAGSIAIRTRMLSLLEGGRLETTAAAGAAGDIAIAMPGDGLILLASGSVSSGITTSSGPGTGGRILISAPRAIVSHGAQILALGEQRGANVQIESEFFIRSADRLNRVAVDGDFLLEAQAGDVSSGTVERDLSILDASGVLRGQCAVARATGQVSQLVVRPTGAFAPAPPAGAADDPCR